MKRKPTIQHPPKQCPTCSRTFTPARRWQVFCNRSCRFKAKNDAQKASRAALEAEIAQLRAKLEDKK